MLLLRWSCRLSKSGLAASSFDVNTGLRAEQLLTYREAACPPIDTYCEADVARESVIGDCRWTGECRITFSKTPSTAADGNTGVEEFLANDYIVCDLDAGKATTILPQIVN